MVLACHNSLSDIVEILCNQKDINFNAVWNRKTAVHYACQNSDIESLKHLLARDDLEVNKIEDRQISYQHLRYNNTRVYLHSPLSEACLNGSLEIVKMLKDDGRANFNELIAYVDGNETFNEVYSIFSLGCFSKNKELIEYLLSFSDSERNYKVRKNSFY